MVDMSPEAVTARLRLMGELWELGWKLKESKKIGDASDPEASADVIDSDDECDRSQYRER